MRGKRAGGVNNRERQTMDEMTWLTGMAQYIYQTHDFTDERTNERTPIFHPPPHTHTHRLFSGDIYDQPFYLQGQRKHYFFLGDESFFFVFWTEGTIEAPHHYYWHLSAVLLLLLLTCLFLTLCPLPFPPPPFSPPWPSAFREVGGWNLIINCCLFLSPCPPS